MLTLVPFVWITGLSGVGKSALAERVAMRLRADGAAVLWLDGDALRAAIAPDAGFDRDARHRLAWTYHRLAALALSQRIGVVVSAIALFHDVHAANRRLGARYIEVLVRSPEPLRRERSKATGAQGPQVGADVAAELPRSPHLVLDNDADSDLDVLARQVVDLVQRDTPR